MADVKQCPYSVGQSEKITNFFGERSAQKEMAFILPYIKPDSRVLDVGSGPGSITCDYARLASQGHVVGVDISSVAVENAQQIAKDRQLPNIQFQTGDITEGLSFEDGAFDIVCCHQVIQHLADPISGLKELKRLARPGGFVAFRDGIEALFYPKPSPLDLYMYWTFQSMHIGGTKEAGGGYNMPKYAKQAGLLGSLVYSSVSGRTYISKEEKSYIYQGLQVLMLGKEAVLKSNALKAGLATEEYEAMVSEMDKWMANEDAWMSWLGIEMIFQV